MRIRAMLTATLLILAHTVAHAAEPLQEQFHSSGNTVEVLRAKAKDQVLTVVLRARADNGTYKLKLPLDQVYYIDPVSQRKYLVLKDEKGEWIASPSRHKPGWSFAELSVGNQGRVFWFKFPAPESDTERVNLVLPDITPFDDLPIQR